MQLVSEPQPFGLGINPEELERFNQSKQGQTVGAVLGKHGGDRRGRNDSDQLDNINLSQYGGSSAPYLTARIRRDRPDIAERLDAGGSNTPQTR